MANPFFKCKQFTIYQDKCAMKVTTDACLFGAWCASVAPLSSVENKMLDVGTGTGLLSLMYAQQHPAAVIDAVELDEPAAKQAGENVAASPWPAAVQVILQDVKDYDPSYRYQVIISNPPFYETQLSSPDNVRNLAHHSSRLSLTELFAHAHRLLSETGIFFVLLPAYRTDEAIDIAGSFSLYPSHKSSVKQTPGHSVFRTMLLFERIKKVMAAQEITIEITRGKYSEAFIKLLQPYYLFL